VPSGRRDEEIIVPRGEIVTSKPNCHQRSGWAEASSALAAGDDALVWPEFGNDDDAALEWQIANDDA
jgi:antitoxin MazE